MKRVALADDSLIVREGVARILAGEVDLVASCSDLDELRSAVDTHLPDVVLTDIRMPPTQTDEGIQAAEWMRTAHPAIGVVVLSQFAEPDYAVKLFESGSERRGYLLKDRVSDRKALLAAIDTVAAGGSVVDPDVVSLIMGNRDGGSAESAFADLSGRERDVLALMAQGMSNAAISDELFLSKRTVEKHVNAIFLKLDLGDEQDISRRVSAALVYLSEVSR